jgi:hypothetical protein
MVEPVAMLPEAVGSADGVPAFATALIHIYGFLVGRREGFSVPPFDRVSGQNDKECYKTNPYNKPNYLFALPFTRRSRGFFRFAFFDALRVLAARIAPARFMPYFLAIFFWTDLKPGCFLLFATTLPSFARLGAVLVRPFLCQLGLVLPHPPALFFTFEMHGSSTFCGALPSLARSPLRPPSIHSLYRCLL